MSRSIPLQLYPVALSEDRYQGGYCDGSWIAIACASDREGGLSRVDWVLGNGPSSGDVEAACFWIDPPTWIASGRTPEQAIEALIAKKRPPERCRQPLKT